MEVEGGMMTNAGCVMRKSAATETKIHSSTFSLLSVQEQNAACVYIHLNVCVCVWACEDTLVYTSVPVCVCLSYSSSVFRRHGVLCYIAAGDPPLQSCPSGSPDWISKH